MRAALVLAFFLIVALHGAAAQSALEAGVRALDAQNIAAARAHLRDAQRQKPRDPNVLAALARFHLDEEPPDRASAREYVYRGLLRNADHAGLLRLRLRMAYEDSGAARFETMETLRSVSRRLLRQDPHDAAALRACGQSGTDDLGWRIGTTAVGVDAKGIEKRYDEAAACLDTLLDLEPSDADAQRERLRLALLTMHTGDARRLTGRWAAAAPDRAEAWRWHGLALWFAGDDAAAEAFELALEKADAAEKARWRDPARVRVPGADSVEAAAFWATRDPLLSTPANERWTEHLARMALADLFFGEGPTPGADTKRGAMLVRYGLPADVPGALSGYGPFVSPSEGRLAVWDYGDFHMVFQDWFVSGRFKYYSPPASAFGGPDAPNDYTLIARSLYRKTPERMAVSGVEDLGVLAAYVFPVGETPAVVLAAQAEHPAPVQAFAVSESGGVQRLDRLSGRGEIQVFGGALAPGAYRVQAEGPRGDVVAVTQDSLTVAPPTGTLALSSLVAARWVEEGGSPAPGTFTRGEMVVAPAPGGTFAIGTPLYLYAEVYGLRPGAPYEVEIERIGEGRKKLFGRAPRAPVAVRFEERARNAAARSYYVLDTADAAPGAYTIRLSVREPDGRRAQTTCSVVLRARLGTSDGPTAQ